MRTDNIKFFRKRNARRLRINTSPGRGLTEKAKNRKLFAKVGRSYPAMDNRRNQLRLSSKFSDWFLRRLISKEGEEVQRNGDFQAKTMLAIGRNDKLASNWLLLSMAQKGKKIGSTSNWLKVRDSNHLIRLTRERTSYELWNTLGTSDNNRSYTIIWHVRNQIKKLHIGNKWCNTA